MSGDKNKVKVKLYFCTISYYDWYVYNFMFQLWRCFVQKKCISCPYIL